MKMMSSASKSIVGFACLSFIIATAASAADGHTRPRAKTSVKRSTAPERVVLVDLTGSRIPQRVVVGGQQVNSASPVYVVRSSDGAHRGATSVGGMLSLDPSVTFSRGG